MFSQIKRVSEGVSCSVENAKANIGISRRRAVLAVVVAGMALGFATDAMGLISVSASDVQSITTQLVPGTSSTVSSVAGAGGDSGFTSSHSYNMQFAGGDLKITKINTATNSYTPSELATTVVDRGDGLNNNDTVWYQGTGTNSSSTLSLGSAPVSSVAQAYSGNNLLVGTDNLFTDSSNAQGNDTNIERLDLVFANGITVSNSQVFSVFERGPTNNHDTFKVAAITSLSNGAPSNYGNLITISNYGKTDVVPSQEYIVTRKNDSLLNDEQHPSDMVNQPIGGVVIPTDLLASDDSTIFGYSLFAADVTGSGVNLVNWRNTTFFPITTTEAGGGGLDALGTTAVLFSSGPSVPEPATATLAIIAGAGLLARRGGRRRT